MSIHDLWSLEHCPATGAEISTNSGAYTTLSSGLNQNAWNRATGLPGMILMNYSASNSTGTAALLAASPGWVRLGTSGPAMATLAVQMKEVWNMSAASTVKQFWMGFRARGSGLSALNYRSFGFASSIAFANYIGPTDAQLAPYLTTGLNAEHYIEMMLDVNALTYQVWIDGINIPGLGGTFTTTNVPADGSGFLFFGSSNGANSGAYREVRDFYFLDVDGTAPNGRMGPIRAALMPPTAASAPNYTQTNGYASVAAMISTAASKFGASSLSYNSGSTNYLGWNDAAKYRYSSSQGDLTIEGWVYTSSVTSTTNQVLYSKDGSTVAPYASIVLLNGKWNVCIDSAAAVISVNSGMVINTWYHIALVCASGVWTLYQNGVALATYNPGAVSTFGNNTYAPRVMNSSSGTMVWTGYIDEFRISNVARYTAAFTPPTAAFTQDANTQVLLHFDNTTNGDLMVIDNGVTDSLTAVSNPTTPTPTQSPVVVSPGTTDPLTVSFGTPSSMSALAKLFAVDYRVSNKSNYGSTITPKLIQGASNQSFAAVTIDQTYTYGRLLGRATAAPDGTAWTPAKAIATQLAVNANV